MSAHRPHPSIREHGLSDGCPRCVEISHHPFAHLDDDNLRRHWERMIEVEDGDDAYRSEAEARACHLLAVHRSAAMRLRMIGIRP